MTTNPLPPSEVLVVDLDGTLILGNSFHEALVAGLRRGGLAFRMRVASAMVRRTISPRQGARWRMKQRILRAFETMPTDDRAAVVDDVLTGLRGMLSQPVLERVERGRSAGVPVVLATAAPGLYARPLALALGFSGCLATDSGDLEVIGQAKADAVLDWIRSTGRTADEVRVTTITDHVDDLPLMQISSRVILQGSPSETHAITELLGQEHASLELIDAVSAQPEGGCWLWFDDRATGPLDVWEVRTILSKHRYALGYVGAGRWTRVQPGDRLDHLVLRREFPTPPPMRQRLTILLKRRLIRDRLRIFH